MRETAKIYDLEERTATFAEAIIDFCNSLPKNVITIPLIQQIMKSGPSIGANYMEANGASSPKDFLNKVHISLKEARETKFWLRLLIRACPEVSEGCQILQKEVHELTLIFSKIARTTKNR